MSFDCISCSACCSSLGGFPDPTSNVPAGEPCIWLDKENGGCKHYGDRPQKCRDFEVGCSECLAWRRKMGIDSMPEDANTTNEQVDIYPGFILFYCEHCKRHFCVPSTDIGDNWRNIIHRCPYGCPMYNVILVIMEVG